MAEREHLHRRSDVQTLVRAAMYQASMSGADWTDRAPLKWISPSQTQSRPQASAASARSNVSRKPPVATAASPFLEEDPEVHALDLRHQQGTS